LAALESVVSSFLSYSTRPLVVSEAVVDHDYTLLAMRRCGEGSKDLWNGLVASSRKMETLIAEPIRVFIHEDLRQFKVSTGPRCLHPVSDIDPRIGYPPRPRTCPKTV
jgi:hypothetical protein